MSNNTINGARHRLGFERNRTMCKGDPVDGGQTHVILVCEQRLTVQGVRRTGLTADRYLSQLDYLITRE